MLAIDNISCSNRAESCSKKSVTRLKVAVQRAKLQLVARRLRRATRNFSNLIVVKSKKTKVNEDRTRAQTKTKVQKERVAVDCSAYAGTWTPGVAAGATDFFSS